MKYRVPDDANRPITSQCELEGRGVACKFVYGDVQNSFLCVDLSVGLLSLGELLERVYDQILLHIYLKITHNQVRKQNWSY